jgi:hypothetical protein
MKKIRGQQSPKHQSEHGKESIEENATNATIIIR